MIDGLERRWHAIAVPHARGIPAPLYLNNALARGEFQVQGSRVDLAAIHVPMFVVGTETDHVAPWQSVYKIRGLTRSTDYTFLADVGRPQCRHRQRARAPAGDAIASAPG